MCQVNYRPHQDSDVNEFHYPSQMFADSRANQNINNAAYQEPEDLKWDPADPDAAASRFGRYNGPISLFGKRHVDPTWDFLNDTFLTRTDNGWNGAEFAINAEDLGRPHTIAVTFEANQGVNYEVEIIRHFEIVPSEESPLEVRQAQLSDNYSSALDLVRKHSLGDLNYNPFAPPQFSTKTTVWQMDPILTEQMKMVQSILKTH